MKFLLKNLLLAMLIPAGFSALAADRIAVADPQVKGGIKAEEVAGFSDYIESRLGSKYELYSRAALKSIVKEWEFSQSGLVLDDEQKGAMEQKNVHLLLVPTIAKVGNQISFTLLTVDPVTGKADPRHRAGMQVNSFSDLFRRVDSALIEAGLREKEEKPAIRKVALLPAAAAEGVVMPPGTGAELTNRLGELLLKSGSVELLSREDLERMAKEAKLASSELASPEALAKLGNLQIADDIAVIHVSRFQTRVMDSTTAIAGTASSRVLTDLSIQLRLVDTSTGNIVALENVDSKLDSREIPAAARRDWSAEDYRSEAIRRLAEKAADRIVGALDPLLVAAVDGKTAFLTRGEGTVKVGTTYRIYSAVGKLIHPRTGKVIGTAEKEVGELKVTDVQEGFSTAEITRSSGVVASGAVCRKPASPNASSGAESAPAYPKAQ